MYYVQDILNKFLSVDFIKTVDNTVIQQHKRNVFDKLNLKFQSFSDTKCRPPRLKRENTTLSTGDFPEDSFG